jgi:cytochrome c oxidase subunit 1
MGRNRARLISLDHRVIGLQYGGTALVFLLLGFALMLLMRWQLAYPGRPLPLIGGLFPDSLAPGGILLPEFYNSLGAMHGSIMIFLGVVPLGVGAFGNYLVPILIGAPDMAFPRLNAASYWTFLAAGLVMLASFFVPGGAPNSGWTSYPPLATIATLGQDFWLVGILLLGVSSTIGSINTIVTIVQLRRPGLGWMQLPFFVWTQLVSALLLLLAFPPLQGAAVLQLMDRLLDTSFFSPAGLIVTGQLHTGAGGGSPVLWQHLFWFLGHPEVYVLLLPALGIVAHILCDETHRPLYGYRSMVGALLALGALSMLVWAHHMFLTDMGPVMSGFFQATTLIISIPSVAILTCLLLHLWGGWRRTSTSMLFALGFLPMFGIGGLTGLPLGMAVADIHLHDTYYVIGHFHMIVAPGVLIALFAGIYHWWPLVTGRPLNHRLGVVHFWGTLLAMLAIFLPMFVQGLAGVSRRLWDAGMTYEHAQSTLFWNKIQTHSAWTLTLMQIPFVWNLIASLRKPRTAAAPDAAAAPAPGSNSAKER